jgi:hypothetical protein
LRAKDEGAKEELLRGAGAVRCGAKEELLREGEHPSPVKSRGGVNAEL